MFRSGLRGGLVAAVALLALSASAGARPRDGRARSSAFGTSALTIYQVGASGCSPVFSDTVYEGTSQGYRYRTGGSTLVDCPLNPPSGALLDSFEVLVHDANDTANVTAVLLVCGSTNPSVGCNGYGSVDSAGTSATPFDEYLFGDLTTSGLTVDKFHNEYHLRLVLGAADSTNTFRQVNLYYRLQVSTPPVGTQTFLDVPPTHPFYRAIEALAASGITAGCGAGNFCPGLTLTRGEMAAFLARALGLHFPD